MKLTRELLTAGRSSAGGFNLSQLRVLGIAPARGWPAKGWTFGLVGTEIGEADYAQFIALRGEAGKKQKVAAIETQPPLF